MVNSARRRKRRTHVKEVEDVDSPRVVVIRRGSLRPELKQLVQDLRMLFSPNCASRLREGGHQRMKDFTGVSDALGLTHIVSVSETARGCYLRVANLPNGPTLTFSIELLTLVSDIAKQSSNPKSVSGACQHSPLVVLNGFMSSVGSSYDGPSEEYSTAMKTVSSTFNSLFSPIDVSTTTMNICKRVVLFNKNRGSDVIVLRHYLINVVDCNTSSAVQDLIGKRAMKRLLRDKNASFKDIVKPGALHSAGSNVDDDYVELQSVDSRGQLLRSKYGLNKPIDLEDVEESDQKIGISLVDAGPRMNLRLIKIQDGVFTGSVTFHKFVTKTPEEAAQLEKAFAEKRRQQSAEEERKRRKAEDDSSSTSSGEE
uniref:Brix domain containing protein n=1 Tax=Babesia bovis TaxID=5865 RepID=S6BKZ8_BABBO|nr:Brix domain containing protein [Babesia bovis]